MQESHKSRASIDINRPSKDSNHKPLSEDEPNTASDSLQVKSFSIVEPNTHLKNKSFGEKYCGTICCVNKTKLSHDELLAYYKLKEVSSILIPKDSEEFDYLFRRLWGNLSSETLDNIVDKRWEGFGFQNQNPRSDMRGGGLLALNHLIYYTHNFKNQVTDMCKPANVFLFASSSINVTFFLMKYYHQTDDISLPRDKKEIASRKALKSMCSILEEDEEAINKIYAILMTDLFNIWMDMFKSNPNLTLMDFPKAFNIMKRKYNKATKKLLTSDLGGIITAYKNIKSKMLTRHANFQDEKEQSTAIEVEVGTRIERLEDMEAQRHTDRVVQELPEVEIEEPGWYIWISYCMLFYYGITFVLGLVFLVLALAFAASAKYIMIIDVLWCIFQILLWNNAVNAITETEKTKFDWLLFLMRINFLLLLIPLVLDYTFKTDNFLELAKLCALDPILYEVLTNSETVGMVLTVFILLIIPGYFYLKTVAFRKNL